MALLAEVFGLSRLPPICLPGGCLRSEWIPRTLDIYPIVAVWLQKKPGATGRAIERLAARCWDLGDRGRLSEIAGKNLREPPAPRDIMIYFAWYSHKGIPYFEAMKGKQPLLF